MLSLCRTSLRFGLSCALSFSLWALWSLLLCALVFQLWIASSGELSLPSPFLRIVERQLSPPGLSVKLGSVVFDPSGHLVVRDFSVIMNSFEEPILKGRLLHTRVDPWGLLVGSPKARQLEVSGISVLLPTALSPTGKPEACIFDLNAVLIIESKELSISELTARTHVLNLAARGGVRIEPFRLSGGSRTTMEEKARKMLAGLRRFVAFYPQLEAASGVRADLSLTPSDSRGAVADLVLCIDTLQLPPPAAGVLGPLKISARLPLAGDTPAMVRVEAQAGAFSNSLAEADNLAVLVRGIYRPNLFSAEIKEAEVSAKRVSAKGVEVFCPSLRIEPLPLPRVRFSLAASVADSQLEAEGEGDISERSAKLSLRAAAGNATVDLVGKLIKRDLGKFVQLPEPGRFAGTVEFAPGGRLLSAKGWVEADRLDIYRVPVGRVQGDIFWDGVHLAATNATLWKGENIARGSYEMTAPTRDFRFLLEGGLRPMDISPWFKEWWPNLWSYFDFTAAVPMANVDVRGRWKAPSSVTVYVGADVSGAAIKKVLFTRAWAQVFVISQTTHVPYMHGVRPEGEARGWFSRIYDPADKGWERILFDVTGRMMPNEVARLFDPQGSEIAAPFWFSQAPDIQARGRIEGPSGFRIPKQDVDVSLSAKGPFRLFDFPVEDVKANARWTDRILVIPQFEARYAQGKVTGNAKLNTEKEKKHLEFDALLEGARLGEASSIADHYFAKRAGRTPSPKSSQDKLGESIIRLHATAQGRYDNPLSFHGTGEAEVSGAELGQVKMLGLLSELLRFTTLRFTGAKTNFTIEGPQLVFPMLQIAGRNSAIEAHGRYSLETKTLDFNAKVWPFEKSQGLVQEAMKLVLSPFSHVFEVKLNGTLADPKWSFSNNPFRIRAPEAVETPAAAPDPAALPTSPNPEPNLQTNGK